MEVRIDKWLWSVRIYKTRSIATDECNKGRVLINGVSAKPSRTVKMGDVIIVRKPPVLHTYLVKGIIDKRVSAPIAALNAEDLTSEEELAKREQSRTGINFLRDRGTGRPTKRDRREIDRVQDDFFDNDDE